MKTRQTAPSCSSLPTYILSAMLTIIEAANMVTTWHLGQQALEGARPPGCGCPPCHLLHVVSDIGNDPVVQEMPVGERDHLPGDLGICPN